MSDRNHKLPRSRRFRLELLESRELLSAIGLPSHGAAEVSPLVKKKPEIIQGSASGLGKLTLITSTTGTLTATSTGTATVLGAVTVKSSDSFSANRKHVLKYTHGVGSIANLSVGSIDVTFTGTGRETGVISTFSVKGPVTGGAGQFAGAKGSFTATGSFNDITDAFSMSFKATLTRT